MREILIPLKEKSYKVFLGELPEIKLKQKALIISDSIVAWVAFALFVRALERLRSQSVRDRVRGKIQKLPFIRADFKQRL